MSKESCPIQCQRNQTKKREQFKKDLKSAIRLKRPWDRVLYLDEASIQYAATCQKMYALKGTRPEIPNVGGRRAQHLVGALDPGSTLIHFRLIGSLKANDFLDFLREIADNYRSIQRILIVLDNARVHHSKIVQQWVQSHNGRIELLFLPPYSPDLNPIEIFWSRMRFTVTHNTYYPSFLQFQQALLSYLVPLTKYAPNLHTLCNLHS